MAEETKEKDESLSKDVAAKWRKEILSINDRKELSYIQDLIYARLQLGDAELRLKETTEEKSNVTCPCVSYNDTRKRELPPVSFDAEDPNNIG